MKIRLVLAAVATVSLASAAHAQTTAQPAAPPPMSMTAPPASDPPVTVQSRSTVQASPAAVAAGVDASAMVTTTTVTNGPVADTPENRAKYGQPMSNAGKRSKAKGD